MYRRQQECLAFMHYANYLLPVARVKSEAGQGRIWNPTRKQISVDVICRHMVWSGSEEIIQKIQEFQKCLFNKLDSDTLWISHNSCQTYEVWSDGLWFILIESNSSILWDLSKNPELLLSAKPITHETKLNVKMCSIFLVCFYSRLTTYEYKRQLFI